MKKFEVTSTKPLLIHGDRVGYIVCSICKKHIRINESCFIIYCPGTTAFIMNYTCSEECTNMAILQNM